MIVDRWRSVVDSDFDCVSAGNVDESEYSVTRITDVLVDVQGVLDLVSDSGGAVTADIVLVDEVPLPFIETKPLSKILPYDVKFKP